MSEERRRGLSFSMSPQPRFSSDASVNNFLLKYLLSASTMTGHIYPLYNIMWHVHVETGFMNPSLRSSYYYVRHCYLLVQLVYASQFSLSLEI